MLSAYYPLPLNIDDRVLNIPARMMGQAGIMNIQQSPPDRTSARAGTDGGRNTQFSNSH